MNSNSRHQLANYYENRAAQEREAAIRAKCIEALEREGKTADDYDHAEDLRWDWFLSAPLGGCE